MGKNFTLTRNACWKEVSNKDTNRLFARNNGQARWCVVAPQNVAKNRSDYYYIDQHSKALEETKQVLSEFAKEKGITAIHATGEPTGYSSCLSGEHRYFAAFLTKEQAMDLSVKPIIAAIKATKKNLQKHAATNNFAVEKLAL